MRDVDATLMLGSRAGRIRLTAWCRHHAGFLAAYWASRWWHARPRPRKDHHG